MLLGGVCCTRPYRKLAFAGPASICGAEALGDGRVAAIEDARTLPARRTAAKLASLGDRMDGLPRYREIAPRRSRAEPCGCRCADDGTLDRVQTGYQALPSV